VREILATEEIKASVVSYWELMLKKGRQDAPVLHPAAWWDRYVTRAAVEVLRVRVSHMDRLDALPEWHRDPFDRMLVAQALGEGCTLVSRDGVLGRYGAPVVWEHALDLVGISASVARPDVLDGALKHAPAHSVLDELRKVSLLHALGAEEGAQDQVGFLGHTLEHYGPESGPCHRGRILRQMAWLPNQRHKAFEVELASFVEGGNEAVGPWASAVRARH
jgi:PIN domain nuclease of toxin-antitoxin system